MNWIVTLTRNNLELTKRAIESFRAQDIGDVRILVVENDSSDNSANWLASQDDLTVIYNKPQAGVAGGWNQALRWLMNPKWDTSSKPPMPLPPMADYVLSCNNDVVLHKSTYRWLVEDGNGFVTAVGTKDPQKIIDVQPPDPNRKRNHPDYSAWLMRRWVWEKVGEFDECFEGGYCEDASHHLRMHRAGINAVALELPFLHYGAQTVKNAEVKEQQRIQRQADKNRQLFKSMYGFGVGTEEYYRAFGHGQPPADIPAM